MWILLRMQQNIPKYEPKVTASWLSFLRRTHSFEKINFRNAEWHNFEDDSFTRRLIVKNRIDALLNTCVDILNRGVYLYEITQWRVFKFIGIWNELFCMGTYVVLIQKRDRWALSLCMALQPFGPWPRILSFLYTVGGRAIAEAVSRWLPTAAVRVRARVW
jgi:hypothetical protein